MSDISILTKKEKPQQNSVILEKLAGLNGVTRKTTIKVKTSVWTTGMKAWLAFQDALAIFFSLTLAFYLRFNDFVFQSAKYPIKSYIIIILVSLPSWILINYLTKLYDEKNLLVGNEEYRQIIHASALGIIATMAVSSWLKMDIARGWLVISWTISTALLILSRYAYRQFLHKKLSSSKSGVNLIVIGANDEGLHLAKIVDSCRYLGFKTVGVVGKPSKGTSLKYPVIGNYEKIPDIIEMLNVGAAVIVPSALPTDEFKSLNKILSRYGVATYIYPSMREIISSRVAIQPVGGIPLISLEIRKFEGLKLFIKRTLDIVVATFLLILSSPLMITLSILIKLGSPGTVLFSQTRVGKDGKIFKMYKFRSMFDGADRAKDDMVHLNEVTGPIFKMKEDPRITKVGKFMRRWSLDELPQLFNVIKGDMSVVGPRPLPIFETEKCNEWEIQRLDALPGLTGLWQINGRSDLPFDDMIKFDLYYIENWSPTMDLYILFRTVPVILSGKGAY